jgi:hypothetical protein
MNETRIETSPWVPTDPAIRATGRDGVAKWGRLVPDMLIPRPIPRLHSTDAATGAGVGDARGGRGHRRWHRSRSRGEVALFAGEWVPSHRPTCATATSSCARHTQGSRPNPSPRDHTVDVETLLCPVLCHHVAFIACGCPAQHRRTQPSRFSTTSEHHGAPSPTDNDLCRRSTELWRPSASADERAFNPIDGHRAVCMIIHAERQRGFSGWCAGRASTLAGCNV